MATKINKDVEKKLTMKQENFCIEYLKCGNQSEAYRRAYDADEMSDETIWNEASKLTKNPLVATRIDELKKDIEKTLGISKTKLIQDLLDLKERCFKPEPVMEWVFNEETGKKERKQMETKEGELIWMFDSAGANSALDKVMKAMDYYGTQKIKIEKDYDLSKLTSEEIKQLAVLQQKLNSNE